MARIVTCTRPRIGNGRDGRAYFEAPPSGIVGYPCGAIVLYSSGHRSDVASLQFSDYIHNPNHFAVGKKKNRS